MADRHVHAELKELVAEACRALAHLDADRLEELAWSCETLNRDLPWLSANGERELTREVREAATGMAVLARVLEATRANLSIMNRLRELRLRRAGYGEPASGKDWESTQPEGGHGDN